MNEEVGCYSTMVPQQIWETLIPVEPSGTYLILAVMRLNGHKTVSQFIYRIDILTQSNVGAFVEGFSKDQTVDSGGEGPRSKILPQTPLFFLQILSIVRKRDTGHSSCEQEGVTVGCRGSALVPPHVTTPPRGIAAPLRALQSLKKIHFFLEVLSLESFHNIGV